MPQLNSPIYIGKEYSLLLGAMWKSSCKWMAVGTIKNMSLRWWLLMFVSLFVYVRRMWWRVSSMKRNITPTPSRLVPHRKRKPAAILWALPYRCWLLICFSFSSALQRKREKEENKRNVCVVGAIRTEILTSIGSFGFGRTLIACTQANRP